MEMNFNEYVNTVAQAVGGTAQDVKKVNGQSYYGVAVPVTSEGDRTMAATFNMDNFYENNVPVEKAVKEIKEKMKDAAKEIGTDAMLEIVSDYKKAKDYLSLHLIGKKGNEEILSQAPHKDYEDLALTYRVERSESDDMTASVLVNNNLLQNWGIDAEQLHKDAMETAKATRPVSFRTMADVMREMMGTDIPASPEDEEGLWVLTVKGNKNGASALFYPDVMEMIKDRVKGDYYILPSSIHEILVVPNTMEMSVKDLATMVASVNDQEVSPGERLSYSIYKYDGTFKKVEVEEDA